MEGGLNIFLTVKTVQINVAVASVDLKVFWQHIKWALGQIYCPCLNMYLSLILEMFSEHIRNSGVHHKQEIPEA